MSYIETILLTKEVKINEIDWIENHKEIQDQYDAEKNKYTDFNKLKIPG